MKPTPGDSVQVHYTGRTSDGDEFDSSAGRDPLEFMVGAGMVIPGFDAAVSTLAVGESTTVKIPMDEAYGDHDEDLIHAMPHDFFGGELPEVGYGVQLQNEHGHIMPATVVAVDETTVTLDLNHPLAGKDLEFDIELVAFTAGDLPPMGAGCGCGDGGCGDVVEEDDNCCGGGSGGGCGGC